MHFLYNNALLESEVALLQSTSEAFHEGYYVHFHSEKYPGHYDGNSLWCLDHPNVRVTKLVEKWNEFFPEAKHRNIFLNAWSDKDALIKEAEEAGFSIIEQLQFMIASTLSDPQQVDSQIKVINTETDWEAFREHIRKANPEVPWFAEEGFLKTKEATAKMPIHWFGLWDESEAQILSSAGLFKHRHLARLQQVQTDPDHFRKGYSTRIMKHILRFAHYNLGVEQVALMCDPTYHAYTFYRQLGFEDRFEMLQLKDFPI